MKQWLSTIGVKSYQLVASPRFMIAIISTFFVQALWFACFVRYPMAFDENYHLGIIQLYAKQWSPFFSSIPDQSGAFGNLTRDPSYLYHYLMSFPYRLVSLFTSNEYIHILVLRLLTIGLFFGGLLIFRRVLYRVGVSRALTHFSLFMLILIPVVPFLAATINYDNLLFLLTPLSILLTLNTRDAIRKRSHNMLLQAALLLIVGFFACLTNYAYAPIFAGLILYLLIIAIRSRRFNSIFLSDIKALKTKPLVLVILVGIGLIVSGGLFIERYGYNVAVYHSIAPECSKVESVDECMSYSPWSRNYQLRQTVKSTHPFIDPDPITFTAQWLYYMVFRLYFAINYNYVTVNPLPLPIMIATIVGGVGALCAILFARRLFHQNHDMLLFLFIIVFYIGSLFYVNYSEYLKFSQLVAINGRYLIIIMPILFVVFIRGYQALFRRVRTTSHSLMVGWLMFLITIGTIFGGGGMLTHLLASNKKWYYPGDSSINLSIQHMVRPVIIGAKKS